MREDNSRNTILACALSLFAESGYDAVGVARIVEAAGVKKPTLYYFFGSKQGLYEELLKVNFESLFEILESLCRFPADSESTDEDINTFLLRITTALFDFAQRNKEFYLLALSTTFAPPSAPAARMVEPYTKRYYALIEDAFERLAASQEAIKGREHLAALDFTALIDARIGFWNHDQGKLGKSEAQYIVSQFLNGLLRNGSA